MPIPDKALLALIYSTVVIIYLGLTAYLARLLLRQTTKHPVLFLGAVAGLLSTLPLILTALGNAVESP